MHTQVRVGKAIFLWALLSASVKFSACAPTAPRAEGALEVTITGVPPEVTSVKLEVLPVEPKQSLQLFLTPADNLVVHLVESVPVGSVEVRVEAPNGTPTPYRAFTQTEIESGQTTRLEIPLTSSPQDPIDSAELSTPTLEMSSTDILNTTLSRRGPLDSTALAEFASHAATTLGHAPRFSVRMVRLELVAGGAVDVNRLEDLWRDRFDVSLAAAESSNPRIVASGSVKEAESRATAEVQNTDLAALSTALNTGSVDIIVEGEAKRSAQDNFQAGVRIVLILRAE